MTCVLDIFYVWSDSFLACRIMIALLFHTESDRLQFFCVWHRTTAGGRVARSFIKLLDVEGSAGREVGERNCGALRSTQREPIEHAGVGYRCSLVMPRGGQQTHRMYDDSGHPSETDIPAATAETVRRRLLTITAICVRRGITLLPAVAPIR